MMDFLRGWAEWRRWPRAWLHARADTTPPPGDVALETEPRETMFYASESELRAMAANAAAYPGCETADFLFGLKTPADHFVIYYATQAGRNAIHQTAFCRPDLAHFQAVDRRLTQDFGVRFVGRAHSHHGLGLTCPSGGDVGSATRLARRNNFEQMVEIILTTESSGWSCRDVGRVHVHAYVYVDAQDGKYVPATLKIIPGVSPVRRALSEGDLMDTDEPADWQSFPMARIVFDMCSVPAGDEHGDEGFLAGMAEQFGELPEEVRSSARVRSEDGMTILCLPLDERAVVAIAYKHRSSQPQAVYLLGADTNGHCDLTNHILPNGRHVRLAPIYDYAARWARGERLREPGTDRSAEAIHRRRHGKRARAKRESGNQDRM